MTTSDSAAEHRAALGRTLRELRSSRGLTLRDVAGLLAVSPATLSAIENGKTGISSERIARLAEALDVPVQRVFATSDGVSPGAPERPRPQALDPGPAVPGDWRSYPPLRLDPALDGALSSFLEFGYHGAPMRTIAERAHLSVPGLYHYYASKQEMLVALLDLTMHDLRVRTEAARDEGGNAVERFALIVECLALFHTHRRELAFVGASEMRSLEGGTRERVAATRRDEQRMVDREVEAGGAPPATSAPPSRTRRPARWPPCAPPCRSGSATPVRPVPSRSPRSTSTSRWTWSSARPSVPAGTWRTSLTCGRAPPRPPRCRAPRSSPSRSAGAAGADVRSPPRRSGDGRCWSPARRSCAGRRSRRR